jgi:hypothetical protein
VGKGVALGLGVDEGVGVAVGAAVGEGVGGKGDAAGSAVDTRTVWGTGDIDGAIHIPQAYHTMATIIATRIRIGPIAQRKRWPKVGARLEEWVIVFVSQMVLVYSSQTTASFASNTAEQQQSCHPPYWHPLLYHKIDIPRR